MKTAKLSKQILTAKRLFIKKKDGDFDEKFVRVIFALIEKERGEAFKEAINIGFAYGSIPNMMPLDMATTKIYNEYKTKHPLT